MSQDRIQGLHHITLCTGTAQGDVDIFYKLLGMSLVKRTLLYDGAVPIFHLYFGNEKGDGGTLTTVFPFRQSGRKARRGAGQVSAVSYSVPKDSIEAFWKKRLSDAKVPGVKTTERFGQRVLQFDHPDCGIPLELVEDENDTRPAFKSDRVPEKYAIRGFHSWTVTTREMGDMGAFLDEGWNYKEGAKDGSYVRFQEGKGGSNRTIDLRILPDATPGSWMYGEGFVHHGAFEVKDYEVQDKVKFEVEGMGFTDFSDRKHRGYFESIYVRTPGGALFEATVALGFTVDEPADKLGQEFIVSPQFEAQKEELLKRVNEPFELT
jgi:catechol 2,3-dioxygenase-like lactoylglutathione lyase family enzyme